MARVLSERDYEKLQEMVRWWERNKNLQPIPQRRRNIAVDSGRRTRIAYCKDDAGAAQTIDCYLDTDATGTEITVHCNVAQGGANLNAVLTRLKDGDPIFVEKIWDGTNNYWWCVGLPFMPSEDCECTSP